MCQHPGMHFEDGIKEVKQLLQKIIPVRTIVVYGYNCCGIMNYLRSRNTRIPDDIVITDFSGTVLSEMIYPLLTMVDLPLFEIGKTATKLILEKINNPFV